MLSMYHLSSNVVGTTVLKNLCHLSMHLMYFLHTFICTPIDYSSPGIWNVAPVNKQQLHELIYCPRKLYLTLYNMLSLSQRYRSFVYEFNLLKNLGDRKDTVAFQTKVLLLLTELRQLENFVQQLNLFSDNESLEELNPLHIQYINIDFYFAWLYSICLCNPKTNAIVEVTDGRVSPIEYKEDNLVLTRTYLVHYLITLQSFKTLSDSQSKKLNLFKSQASTLSYEEYAFMNSNPATKRAEKIENYKLEKSLVEKLEILNDYYKSAASNADQDDLEEEDIFLKFDEEIIRNIYVDQLKLFALNSFGMLELILLELDVLSKRPKHLEKQKMMQVNSGSASTVGSDSKYNAENDYGYTPRLENVYNANVKGNEMVSSLLSKQGKILQPFTITSTKKDLQKKVFGTGQVLPSMSVEEYLDYELANGKMIKEEAKDSKNDDEDDTDDSDAELEKRKWDDWKDDNPKGMGNTGGNLG